MPRSSNQKFKPLYLARIFDERTDEDNVLTAQELVDALALYDVPANRKSIYDDIDALRQFGMDIELRHGKDGGYYLASRDFEIAELKLLVDAVQSSRFITTKKSNELIKKLSKLASASQAKQLNRQVFIAGRAKAINETIYYNIDAIHAAINEGKKISFKYFEYDMKKNRIYRRKGKTYVRTPVALCWSDDKYYLIAYCPMFENPYANYRVDRMANVEVINDKADKYDRKAFNISKYITRSFGMFSGEVIKARLAFDEEAAHVVFDHFGTDLHLSDAGGGRFAISVEVANSWMFLTWMLQLGKKAEILEPESLRESMRKMLAVCTDIYK